MTVKVAIGPLSKATNVELTSGTDAIGSAMTGNINYPAQDSGIQEVITLNTALKNAMTALKNAGGGAVLVADVKARRAALLTRLRVLATYVQLHCQNNLQILLSSGLTAQKQGRTPATILPAPTMQSLGPSANTGVVAFKVYSQGARIYSWQCYLASAPDVMITVPQTSAANTSFPGLTPGATYFFQANAVNSAGTSDWSAPVSLIVT